MIFDWENWTVMVIAVILVFYGVSAIYRNFDDSDKFPALMGCILAVIGIIVVLIVFGVAGTRSDNHQARRDLTAVGLVPASIATDNHSGTLVCGPDKRLEPVGLHHYNKWVATTHVNGHTVIIDSPAALLKDFPGC